MKVRDLQEIIWDHIGDQWLLGKGAAMLLAASAVASVGGIVAMLWRWPVGGVGGELLVVAVVLSALFLLSAMKRYWTICDEGSKPARKIWFFVLTFVMFLGAALYYLFVYLPQVRRNWRVQ